MRLNRTILVIIGVVLLAGLLVTIGAVAWLVGNIDTVGEWLARSNDPILCSDSAVCSIAQPIIFGLILVFVLLTGFAYTTLLERKILAWLQQRSGPNRVGPGGFLQPAADGIKLVFKEDIVPDKADKAVYYLAPMLKAVPVLIVAAVLPLGPALVVPGFDGNWYTFNQGLSDVNVGILWILGITSLATYGIVLVGWSSNNKYAMLGGLRASAQMISYELSMGLTLAVPVMIAGSMSIGDIIEMQQWPWQWFVFQNPLAAGILVIALFAEVSRAPFDLSEAEQELTAGYMTEYSGMKFALFMMAEYLGMIAVSIIAASLFFGGYHLFPVTNVPILGPVIMIGRVIFFLSIFIWVRGTLPRVRYDRLMALGWKVLLPLALVSVAWTAIAVVLRDVAGTGAYMVISAIFFVVIVGGGFFFLSAEQNDDVEDAEDDYFDDPMITGQRRGLAWFGINVLGSVLALPFQAVQGLGNLLENIGEAADPSEDKAIVPRDQAQGGD